ncbi:MAG: hypothetical protein FWE36_08030 [Erysipelotrichales bacterium]|nr:hypothetical protein [Erysipelotrichales bacterium]
MKNKDKFFVSVFIQFVIIFTIVIGFGLAAFITFGPPKNSLNYPADYFYLIPTIGLPTLAFITGAHRGFSIIEFSEKGVKKSLFKIFNRIEITWENVHELRYYSSGISWIFLSKIPLDNMSFNQVIRKKKEVIIIQLSDKNYEILRKYTNKEIINLSGIFKEKFHQSFNTETSTELSPEVEEESKNK